MMHEREEREKDQEEFGLIEEKKGTEWDVETIASTFNNTGNRPQVLAEERSGETKLEKSEVIPVNKETVSTVPKDPPKESDKTLPSDLTNLTKEEKVKLKKEFKAKKREKRVMKKAVKMAYRVFYRIVTS